MTDSLEDLVAKVRAFYVAYDETEGANAADLLDLCADNIRWRTIGGPAQGAEFMKDYNGKENVRAYWEGLYEQWSMIEYTLTEIVADKDRIVVLAEAEFKFDANGQHVTTPKADILTVKDGKIIEFFEFLDTAALLKVTTQ